MVDEGRGAGADDVCSPGSMDGDTAGNSRSGTGWTGTLTYL